jgi:acyl-coenzyme A synthetase/AMP-(fatty) acid ligase
MAQIDWLVYRARLAPRSLAIVSPRVRLSYLQLASVCLALAPRLEKEGIGRGDVVVVSAVNPALHMALVIALNAIGAVSFSLMSGRPGPLPVPSGIMVRAILSDKELIGHDAARQISVGLDWLKEGRPLEVYQPTRGFDADEAMTLLSSSGTTGIAKTMVFSARDVDARVVRYGVSWFVSRAGESTMSLFGLTTMYGYAIAFATLYNGGTLYMGFPMQSVAKVIERARITHLVAPPAHLAQLAVSLAGEPADCSSLKHVTAGGSAMTRNLVENVTKRICGNFFNGYGATEAGMIAAGPALPLSRVPGAVGFVAPWNVVEAVDEAGRVLPPGETGMLRFRGPQVLRGYAGDPEATQRAFRDGCFYSGDLGTVTKGRMLVILGREDDVINIGGTKFSGRLVEEVLSAFPGISDSAAFVMTDAEGRDEVWAAIAARGEVDLQALLAHCRGHLREKSPRYLFRLNQLPRNASGKIVRGQLHEAALLAKTRDKPGKQRD